MAIVEIGPDVYLGRNHLDELLFPDHPADFAFRIIEVSEGARLGRAGQHAGGLLAAFQTVPGEVSAFIDNLRNRTGKPITGVSRTAMDRFLAYGWPGNVRELKSALEYAFVVADEGVLSEEHLHRQIIRGDVPQAVGLYSAESGDPSEKTALIDALRQGGGNQSQAARILGINRVTVWNRMKKYGIDLKKILTA